MLRITDIQDNKVNWLTVPYCEASKNSVAKYLLQNGDLLFARTGATVGKSFRITGPVPESLFASYLIRVRCSIDGVSRYLAHFFRSQAYWDQVTDFSAGIGQPNVNSTKLGNLVVPLAPLAEQLRIAEKLDFLLQRVDSCRARLERVPQILKRFREAVLEAAVSGRLTEEWRTAETSSDQWEHATLGTTGIVSGGLTKNATRNTLPLRKPYLRVANVYANRFELSDVTSIGLTDAEWTKTALRAGDVLIVEGNGSLDQIGRVALWEGEIPECSHQNHLIRWRTLGRVDPKLALLWLMSPRGRKALMRLASTSAGLYTLSISKVSSVPISIPPPDEQREIVRRVWELFALADRLQRHYGAAVTRVTQITSSILATAFRGGAGPARCE